MTRDLVTLLCCPDCRSELDLEDAAPAEHASDVVERGALVCRGCRKQFPIERGIPRFVASDGYVESFSYQWNRWPRVQLDIANGGHVSEETFALKSGFTRTDLKDRLVLDVGCGAGRFLDVASRWGARVVGVDYSFAVDAAQRNVGLRPNVNIVQADVFHLPFRTGVFDVVYSLGVLHHTRDTREAFLALPPLIRDGGQLAVWLYYYADPVYRRATDFWRRLLAPFGQRGIRAWSWLLCALFSRLYRLPALQREPLSIIPRLLPVGVHPEFRWAVLDTFDWYSPAYQDKECEPLRVLQWCYEGRLRHVEFLPFPTSLKATRDVRELLPLAHGWPDFRRKRCVLFGAGSGGRVALEALAGVGLTAPPVAVVDNDRQKHGAIAYGQVVRPFEALPRDSYDYVVISGLAGEQEIAAQLQRAGLERGRDYFTVDYFRREQRWLRIANQPAATAMTTPPVPAAPTSGGAVEAACASAA